MLEIIVNKEPDKKSIMLVENGILIEKHEEHYNRQRLEGNIYCGRVQNVLEGMQSAFIDIGDKKNTFIRLKDILPKEDEAKTDGEYKTPNCNIKDIIKSGDKILVQVKRDGTETKGARVSTHINLPGRFIVFMPNSNFITVSQKIDNQTERERLINIVKNIIPENTGAIIRTSAEKINEEKLKIDLELLIKKWKKIKNEYNQHNLNGPKLVYDNKALLRRTLIDLVDQKLNKVIVNDSKTHKDISEILKSMDMLDNIKLELRENENLLELYSLREQLEKLDNRKIWLKCGGFITIDRTEALTAIDVNTGRYTGNKDLEHTVFKVNKEATLEIAKQLRLRDIGGIIIVDYIDMHNDEGKNEIVKLLEEELKRDRTKSQVLGFTKLNLLEMTRKNMCNNDDF
ncbi:MAG: Rne/Rng family ribonuclease [Clostridia bacterium]|nr:Rne/Rng family ribonuclease [Clostridia bacterium]